MQFKHPELLYALFLLLIPIIVHLFQLRKFQKEYFTNVEFLKKVKLQTRKSSQIKKWLTLLTRLLLLAFIILAFAQPFTSKTNTFNAKNETVLYIDNSFSMQAKGEQGELLKRTVQDLINTIDEDEVISVFTNDNTYKNTSIKAIKNDLLQLDYATNQLPYDAVLLKGRKLFSNESNSIKNLILVSDFQLKDKNIAVLPDSIITTHAVKLNPINVNNVSIDSVYVTNSSATNLSLNVLLKNNGNPIENLPVSIFNNDMLLAKTAVTIEKEAVAEFSLPENTFINGRITIDDTSLQFDNTFYFNINKPSKINVLVVNDNQDNFLKRIFTAPEFNYTSTQLNTLNFSDIDNQNLIVLNGLKTVSNALTVALKAFTSQGGKLLIIPSQSISISSYNKLLTPLGIRINKHVTSEKRITTINYSHPLFANVFDKKVRNFQYPKVTSFYTMSSTTASAPLKFEDGSSFLIEGLNTFVFSSALQTENSNFTSSPLIVPTIYNIGKQSFKIPELYYTIGNENTYDVEVNMKQDDIVSLAKGNAINVIPQQQYFNNKVTITTNDTPNNAGIYEIKSKSEILKNVSYNYNRDESIMIYENLEAVKHLHVTNSFPELINTIKSESKINALWKWFIIFALAFLIIEMLILKYFK